MMSLPSRSSLALLLSLVLPLPAAQPWREITVPTVAEAAATFAEPPKEYSAIHWAIWGGLQSKERILADIGRVAANGGGVYMINNSRGMRPGYFTPEYFELVKLAVQECKKRGLKVWIEGDAGYPDGFAGGRISRDYPQLGMQAIVPDLHYTVTAGQTLRIPLPVDTLGILARPLAGLGEAEDGAPAWSGRVLPVPKDGIFKWTAPSGGGSEVLVREPSATARYSVVAGQTLTIPVPTDTLGIQYVPEHGRRGREMAGEWAPATVLPVPAGGPFQWTAPGPGAGELTFVRHVYRSSPTRFVNREDGTNDKDSLYSLIDYLDPRATRTYLKVIYEQYEKVLGDEFGQTILGFRGDETDFTGFMPWTPKLLKAFQAQKGYDLKPYLAGFFANPLTPGAQRAKADYWDVWSGLFRDNFYQGMEDWCRTRHMEFMVHLNHEELMMGEGGDMIRNEGSFFRDMRYVGVPGVDNLNQIGPGVVADFPKLAGSAAHVMGRPLVWDEEGGGLGAKGKFMADYQLVRGINYMNIRGLNTSSNNQGAVIGWYVSRTQHLLALGRPAAQVALFHPTDSMWMGDKEADEVTTNLVTELLEHQIDFDHIDADELATVCKLHGGGLKNLSGQTYRAVIVPTSTVIQQAVLQRLRTFAAEGGRVIFVGRTPTMVVGRTFLKAETSAPDLSFATLEPTPAITDRVVAALPPPDVKLNPACPPVKYLHRHLKDGEVYFFFNESDQTQTRTAMLAGTGRVEVWDAASGVRHPLTNVVPALGGVAVPLSLTNHEARLIVIGEKPGMSHHG